MASVKILPVPFFELIFRSLFFNVDLIEVEIFI